MTTANTDAKVQGDWTLRMAAFGLAVMAGPLLYMIIILADPFHDSILELIQTCFSGLLVLAITLFCLHLSWTGRLPMQLHTILEPVSPKLKDILFWRFPQRARRSSAKFSRRAKVALVFGSIVFLVAGYTQWWIPHGKFTDLKWLTSAAAEEKRRVAHQILRIPLGDHHDAFIALEEVGDQRSVPLLIWALRWQEHTESPSEGMICTKAHCLAALQRITGEDLGLNYDDWKEWYRNQKKHRD